MEHAFSKLVDISTQLLSLCFVQIQLNIATPSKCQTLCLVYKANYHGPAAVKKLKCKSPSREQIHEFQSEVAILSKLRHNQIVLFMAYILDPPDDMCIVMSWCESSLYKRIHIGQTHLTVAEAMRISKEISQVSSGSTLN